MKKFLLLLITSSIFVACGSKTSPRALANEVCDCSKKFEALSLTDPKRADQVKSCTEIQKNAWDKVKDDKEKTRDYSERLLECSAEMQKKSSGK